jgi:hypothetical protein
MSGVIPRGHLFRQYALLGDDIVIGVQKVALMYLRIIKGLGMNVGLAKSILSRNAKGLEFAKRTFLRKEGRLVNVSPIGLLELSTALSSVSNLIGFMRIYSISLPTALKIAGKGYKVLGNLTNSFWKQGSSVRLLLIAVSVPSDMASMSSVYLNSKSALQLPLEAIQQFISEQFSKLYKTMNVDL